MTRGFLSSAISFAAVLYGEDFDGVIELAKADAVVADTETELWGFDIAESFNVAFAGDDRAGQSVQDAKGRSLFDGAEFGLGPILPNDLLGHMLLLRV
jgi:hypothetical protein